MIAGLLPKDKDVLSYMLVCRQTYFAVAHPRSSVWRVRYGRRYDLPPGSPSAALQAKYTALRNMAVVARGYSFRQTDASRYRCVKRPNVMNLALLLKGKLFSLTPRSSIIRASLTWQQDAWKGVPVGGESKNVYIVKRIMRQARMLDGVLDEDANDLYPAEIQVLRAVQVAMFQLALNGEKSSSVVDFRLFRSLAYSREYYLPSSN